MLVRGDRSYVRSPGETLETDLGVLDIPPDPVPGDVLETHLGHAFQVRELRPPDWFEHFERTGAPMIPRDIGLLVGETGVGHGDRVLDVGTGTGVLAAYLGHAGADVLTFERDPDAARVARNNIALAGLTEQVSVRTGDALVALEEERLGGFEVLTLDTGDAPDVLSAGAHRLVAGGFAAVYSPFVEHARSVVEVARTELGAVRTVETIQRELDVDERGTRPSTAPVGHTGYLTFGRKS